jgi:hypothetical protein
LNDTVWSCFPNDAANPELVVAMASNPRDHKMRADPTSQALGMMKVPDSWSSAKRSRSSRTLAVILIYARN